MTMKSFALKAATLYKALLVAHEKVIYTHESIGYKIDAAVKTLEFDDSGITAMVSIKDLLSLLCAKGYITIKSLDSDFANVMKFHHDYSEIKETINDSKIVEHMEEMSWSIENYFKKSDKSITPDLQELLKNHSNIVDIYTKTLKSAKDFDMFVFNKGKNALDGKELELFTPVYIWRDYNSLQAHYKTLENGVYFCFVDRVFGFVLKNGENFVVFSDPLEYKHLRSFMGKRYIPYQKNKVDAGFYLPYSLIQHKGGSHELQLFKEKTAEAFANQAMPSILCDVQDLPVTSLVYVVLMFELLVKKFGFDTSLLETQPVTQHGTSFVFENAIEHKASKNLITVDELRHGIYNKRFPEYTYCGLNTRLEELFSDQVDQRLLNLIEHNDQKYYPDSSGCYVPFNEQIEFKVDDYNSTEVLKLRAFDMTMIGTADELEALRFNVARHNYAAMLDMHSKIYMRERIPKIRKFLKENFYKNIENIEAIMGFSSITIPRTNDKDWSFMTSKKYESKDNNFPQVRWMRTQIDQREGGSSVLKCYKTGSKRYQTILFRVATVEQLAYLLNVPVSKLPEPLNIYSWVNNSHHSLNDPVDALWDIWEQRLIEFEVVICKSHFNTICKKANLGKLESISAIGNF